MLSGWVRPGASVGFGRVVGRVLMMLPTVGCDRDVRLIRCGVMLACTQASSVLGRPATGTGRSQRVGFRAVRLRN
jgi:hypothetical protein